MKQNHLAPFFKKFSLFIFSCIVTFGFSYSQEKEAKIDILMQKYHEYRQFNGTVLVAESGELIFKKGYGLANMEWDIVNEPDTKFRIGSITKQFTSMLIMQLVEEGKIRLDEKMTTYLTDYRKDSGDKVTIHHLLTHTSGIPSFTNKSNYFSEISRDFYEVDEFVKKFCSDSLVFEPGSKFSYNNSGYFLLGAIIEKVTGEKYEDILQKKILDPLGMKNTGYDHHETLIANRASGYEKNPNGYFNSAYLDMAIPYSAGSMYSTVEDLYIWDQALYSEKLLSKKYKDIMFKPFLENYAYGWFSRKISLAESKDSLQTISHGGGINGFNTLITRLIDDKHLIVLLNNTGGTNLGRISLGITNILYGNPYALPQQSIADELFDVIIKKDIATAVKHYHDLKSKNPDNFDFSEGELNSLGYQLLAVKKLKEAIEIFKLNIESYPKSSNVYDSLGEAYMKNGQQKPAITNYKKSLELDPANSNAVEMLKLLEEKQ